MQLVTILMLIGIPLSCVGEDARELTLIGYDTSGGYSKELPASRAISNVEDKGNCSETISAYQSVVSGRGKLLQAIQEPKISLKHCQIQYQVVILDCATRKRDVQLNGGVSEYQTLAVEKDTCNRLYDGEYVNITIDEMFYLGLESTLGETKKQVHEVMGTSQSGTCNGVRKSFRGKAYNNVVFEIHTETYIEMAAAVFSQETQEIIIPNKLRFHPNDQEAQIDVISGTYIYNSQDIPKKECDYYKVILTGELTMHTPREEKDNLETIITIQSKENVKITLMKIGEIEVCGQKLYSTSESRMFIVPEQEITSPSPFSEIELPDVDELNDLRGRVSSISLVMSMKVSDDFRKAFKSICESRQEALHSYFNMMADNQGRTTSTFGRLPQGVEVMNSGAASFLIHGTPLKLKLRSYPDQCCKELPVAVLVSNGGNSSAFMDPRNSIIRPYCSPRPCNSFLPYYYKVNYIPKSVLTDSEDVSMEEREHSKDIWFMTEGTPHVVTCSEPPKELSVMDKTFHSQIEDIMKKESARQVIHDPAKLASQRLAVLVGAARESIMASTAQKVTKLAPGKLPYIMTHHVKDLGMEKLQSTILNGFVDHHWNEISMIILVMSCIFALLVIYSSYKGWICCLRLKKSSKKVRRYGFHLGNTKEIELLKHQNQELEERLDNIVAETSNDQDLLAERTRSLTGQLAQIDNRLSKVARQVALNPPILREKGENSSNGATVLIKDNISHSSASLM